MPVWRELPILYAPAQSFSVTLNGKRCDFDVAYNAFSERWSFDLAVNGAPALAGRRIVTGVDLLRAFSLGIGKLVCVDMSGGQQKPGREELPSGRVRLLHTV